MKLVLIALFTISFGSIANAQNLLTNGDAETGDLTDWTTDLGSPVASAVCVYGGTIDTGTYSFSMDQCDTTDGTLVDTFWYAQISQEVDTTGCNVVTHVGELTGGIYNFSTRYQDRGDDQASYGLTFFDAFHSALETTDVLKASEADILFHDGIISGAIPGGATDVEVRVGGKGIPEVDSHPGAYHDNVVYEFTSCIAAYAVAAGKSSCTAGNEPSGGGDGNDKWVPIDECPKGPAGTFADFIEAQIGLMDGTDTGGTFPYEGPPAPGSFLHIKGKIPQVMQWCHLTPSAITVATVEETGATMTDMDYECAFGGSPSAGTGITVELFNPTSAGKGRDKDRGYVRLTGPVFGDYSVPFRRGMVYSAEAD